MPDQVSFTEVDKSHTQTASSGSENRWQDIASGIMAGAGLAAKAGSKYATVDNLKDAGKACVEGAIIGSAGQVGKAGAKLASDALHEAIQGGVKRATDNIIIDKSGRSLNKADDAADAGKKSGKDKALDSAAKATELGAAIAGGVIFSGPVLGRGAAEALKAGRAAEAAKEAGRAVGQKAIDHALPHHRIHKSRGHQGRCRYPGAGFEDDGVEEATRTLFCRRGSRRHRSTGRLQLSMGLVQRPCSRSSPG